jgi:ParB/RepB/Spo0J family partition protein
MQEQTKKVVSLPLESLVLDGNLREHIDPEKLRELAETLRHGQAEPITVRRNPDGKTFRVINGGRRVRAARLIGLTHLDAIIDEEERPAGEVIERQLVITLQTENFRPGEVAKALAEWQKASGMTQAEMAARLGKSEGFVSKKLMLLLLPPALLAKVDSCEMPESSGYLIAKEADTARKKDLEAMAANGASRDAIAGAAKRQRHQPGNGNAKSAGKVRCSLGGDRAVTVSASDLTMDTFIGILEDVLGRARKARTQGLEVGTLARMFKDIAKE